MQLYYTFVRRLLRITSSSSYTSHLNAISNLLSRKQILTSFKIQETMNYDIKKKIFLFSFDQTDDVLWRSRVLCRWEWLVHFRIILNIQTEVEQKFNKEMFLTLLTLPTVDKNVIKWSESLVWRYFMIK